MQSEWLRDENARKEWRHILPIIRKINDSQTINRADLAAYCNAYSCYVEAWSHLGPGELVTVDDKGNEKENPWNVVLLKHSAEMTKYANRIGLSIDAQLKVGAKRAEQEQEKISKVFGI